MSISKESLYRLVFFSVLSLAFILLMHGGTGYIQIRPLVYFGFGILLLLFFYFVLSCKFIVGKEIVLAGIGIILLMLIPSIIAYVNFSTSTGFNFIAFNITIFIFFGYLIQYFKTEALDILADFFIFFAVISSLVSIYILFFTVDLGFIKFGRENYFRLTGTFATPNRFGEIPAVGVIACISQYLVNKSHRLRYSLIGIFLFLVTLMAGSKGVVLGLAAGLFIYLFFTRIIYLKSIWKLVFLSLPFIALAFFLLLDYIILAMKIDMILEGRMEAGSGRSSIWSFAINEYVNSNSINQIFGHGVTGFKNHYGDDSHSTYFNLLFDYGAISLIALYFLILSVFIKLLQLKQKHNIFIVFGMSLIFFCLVRGYSMPTIFNTFNFAMVSFWAGLSIVLSKVKDRILT